MLTLESAAQELGRLPRLALAGLSVFILGVVADVTLHVLAGDLGDAGAEHTPAELASHDVIFVGMVLILLGVAIDGVQRSRTRRRSPARPSKGAA